MCEVGISLCKWLPELLLGFLLSQICQMRNTDHLRIKQFQSFALGSTYWSKQFGALGSKVWRIYAKQRTIPIPETLYCMTTPFPKFKAISDMDTQKQNSSSTEYSYTPCKSPDLHSLHLTQEIFNLRTAQRANSKRLLTMMMTRNRAAVSSLILRERRSQLMMMTRPLATLSRPVTATRIRSGSSDGTQRLNCCKAQDFIWTKRTMPQYHKEKLAGFSYIHTF